MRRSPLGLLLFSLIAVYVLWGSTGPAIRVAVMTLPPWYLAGIRFLIAGAVLWGFVRYRRVPLPKPSEWRGATIVGVALLVLGNGLFAWALQYMPSNVGIVYLALGPVFMAIFAYVLEGERLTAMGATGLLLGFAGLLYLLTPSGIEQTSLLPTLAVIFSAVTWGLGSILQRRYGGRDLVQGSAMQMLVAGVILIVLAALTGQRMTAASLTPHALVALGYLIVFGSIIGYSCYLWLMRNVSTTLASTYAYVNPVVAIAVSAWLLREHVAVHTLIAAAVIVSGVALMMLAPKPQVARMEQLRAA